MKKIFLTIIALCLFLVNPIGAETTQYKYNGRIVALRTHSDVYNSYSWIQIENVKDIPNALQGDSGKGELTYIAIKPEEKNLYSLVLSAYLADKPITVKIDTDQKFKHEGLARLMHATLY